MSSVGVVIPLVLLAVVLVSGLKILREYERAVVFRLGRLLPCRGPGIIYVIPLVEHMVRIALRTITSEVPTQDVITRDNVSLKVSAVLYFRVVDPNKAIVQIENYLFATSQLAQTTLRSVCGQVELDTLLAEREKVNARIQEILDAQTGPWGIKVSVVEVKHIDLAQQMQRAIARQAEAERERQRGPRLGYPHPGGLLLALRRGLLRAFVTVLFGLCRGGAPCLGRVLLLLLALFRLE
jgi:regulator of protease activity HflC (stomatin/prohibitin superfamily)